MSTLLPADPDWRAMITASKVAPILGIAPDAWGGARRVWNQMKGLDPGEPQTTAQARGHYLEPAVLAWWADQHPEFHWADTPEGAPFGKQTVWSERLEWACSTPDAIATDGSAYVFVEAKTDDDQDAWGRPRTDEIPRHYVVQVMWQMHCCDGDVTTTYVPLLGPYLRFVEYRVDYDATLAARIEKRCKVFYDSLAGDVPPPVDSSPATYESLRRVHPNIIDDKTVSIPRDLASDFLHAKELTKAGEAQYMLARNRIADLMGDAKTAMCGNQIIAVRQSKAGGKPYVAPPRNPPNYQTLGSTIT